MKHAIVTIDRLVRWEGNPRPQASTDKRAALKASIADKGVMLPLIVRHASGPKTGAGRIDEVIAGDTRRGIVAELVAEGAWDATRGVPVIVRDDLVGDEAAALDVALSENIHVPMHPMDQFAAFMQLIELGRDVAEIATAYGVRPRTVEQRLSYAKLDPRARDLVKEGRRDLEWASAMTMATLEEQDEMLREIDADPRRFLSIHDVRRRLEDELVPTTAALFDVSALGDALVRRDLFDEAGATYLARSEFQPRQDAALEALIAERLAEGWSRVTRSSEREFDRFRYNDGVTDKALGEVVFVRHASGAVTEHAGLSLRIEERINRVDDEGDEEIGEALFGSADEAEPTAEAAAATAASAIRGRNLAKAARRDAVDPRVAEGRRTARYTAISLAAVCQAALVADRRLAFAVAVAGMTMTVAPRPVDGRLFGDLAELDPENPARLAIERKLDAVRQINAEAGIEPGADFGDVVARLLGLSDDALLTLLQTAIATRVVTDMNRGDMLLDVALAQDGASLARYWRPDRTYLATLPVEGLRSLASQILPPRLAVSGGKADIVETLAQVVQDAHEGGMRLQAHERETLLAWAPESLGGGARGGNAFDAPAGTDGADADGDDADGEALFAAAA